LATEKKKAAVQKPTARKVKDRWKAKEWYKIHAPMMFNQAVLGETPSADAASLVGRMTEVTVHDLTGDFSKMHVKLKFKVDDVRGFEAHTIFVGQDLTSDYIRRLTRRKKTKTDHVIDVVTKDGYKIRIKPMSITDKRIQASQETAVRTLMTNALQKSASEMTLSELVKAIISGDMARDLSNVSKVIVPIKRVEIRKTEVLEMGSKASQDQSIIEAPAEEAKPTEGEATTTEAPAAQPEETEEIKSEEEVSEEEVLNEEKGSGEQ
jgi:small subunit ribosomal protein S3Ae